jgi:hypothetical protein
VAVALARAASGVVPARADYLATLLTSAVPLVAALAIRAWLGPIELWEAAGWALVLSAAWAAVLLRTGAVRLEELRRLLPRTVVTE